MDFDLESLHWREFEKLVGFYLKARVGEGVTIFSGTKDKGRDATFEGKASEFPSKSQPRRGKWIFQCKHRTTKNSTLRSAENELIRQLNGELEKVFIKHNFSCDNYVYATNLDLSNAFHERVFAVFDAFCLTNNLSNTKLFVIDYKDISIFLSTNSSVRYAFPSLLQYIDLEKVFLRKEELRNKGFLKSAFERINTFVSTNHYQDALDKIREFGFVMLIGNPKSGKTSIVEAISLNFLDEADFKPYFIRETDEIFTIAAYLPSDEKALFICDDIFGRHDLDENKRRDWESYFESVMGVISPRFKFLVTTRRYIYEQFANRSGLRAFFPGDKDPARYTIKLVHLSPDEREQILEKHLSVSDLSAKEISHVIDKKTEILACKDFSPEVIRSLVGLLESAEVKEYPGIIDKHLEHPNQYLFDFFSNIELDKKLLLISLCITLSPETDYLEKAYVAVSQDFDHKSGMPFRGFLEELSGSIVKRRNYLTSSEAEYYHPSMDDVVLSICKTDLTYRSVLLRNANLDILGLLTLRPVDKDESPRIQIRSDEIIILHDSMQRLFANAKSLSDVSSAVRWLRTFNSLEVPYAIHSSSSFRKLEKAVGSFIEDHGFFDRYLGESLDRWIVFLDASRLIMRSQEIPYLVNLEEHHRDNQKYDYWNLVFLLESISPGFIEQSIPQEVVERFLTTLSNAISQLATGLYFFSGRPKTHQRWVPMFMKINDLLRKMRASGRGRQIIESEGLLDWQKVNQNSDFAKNRHRGMVSRGYWKADFDQSLFSRLDENLTEFIGDRPICPSCGNIMELRIKGVGENTGSQFYGCSSFPACKQTLPI